MEFTIIKDAVARKFKAMSGMDLFTVGVDKDKIWEKYLSSFPGGDKLYRTRTEHDCSLCRSFIRTAGDIVAIDNNYNLISIWDIEPISEPSYQVVAKELATYVKSHVIKDCFLTDLSKIGTNKSFEEIVTETETTKVTWNHFYIDVPKRFIKNKLKIGTELSELKARHDVLFRSLTELSIEAINTVLELIVDGTVYRGAEFKELVESFKNIKIEFDKVSNEHKDNFVWAELSTINPAVAKFRNTSIGQLVINISEGVDIDVAIRKHDDLMGGYKRTTAIKTPKMIDEAKKALTELGLISALERRYATYKDMNINDLLFVDNSVKSRILMDVFDELKLSLPDSKKSSNKIETMHIDKFITDVLPKITSMEILLENKHMYNLMSLITAANPTAKSLFKWNNPFSWTFVGDNADSIRQRVKLAGGCIDGEFNNMVGWFNKDDLDAHMKEPNGYEIYYSNRRRESPSGGVLDVDMNSGFGSEGAIVRNAVENITYRKIANMLPGEYDYIIHNFNRRETIDYGFDSEIQILGKIYRFSYRKPIKSNENVLVATFRKHQGASGELELVKSYCDDVQSSKVVWNVATEKFHPVNMMMLSPNYWGDNKVGNKIFIFIINNCINDGSARGFYNEQLSNDLNQHRKAMDLIGSKMRSDENDVNQLSGLGFGSTMKNDVIVKVSGTFTRQLKLTI